MPVPAVPMKKMRRELDGGELLLFVGRLELLGVVEHDVHEELLVVVSQGVFGELLVFVLRGGIVDGVPLCRPALDVMGQRLHGVIEFRWVDNLLKNVATYRVA